MGNNFFFENTVSYFDKLMQKTYVEKSEIMGLKDKFKALKKVNPAYNSLLNKVTRIVNEAKGKNEIKILQEAYKAFTALKAEN